MDLATEVGRGVVEGKGPVMVPVVVVEAAAANDGEPEEPRVLVVVVAATEGEPEGVVEATALRVPVVVVAAVTEGEGVEETSLLSAHWGLQKRNRASCVKIMVMFVQMLAHFTI